MIIPVNLGDHSYNIYIGRGAINTISKTVNLNRRVLIVTDDGVPEEYARIVAAQCKEPHIATVAQGEGSKSFGTFQKLLEDMLRADFERGDCVVAVGGGVVGDLAGFVAASYMRGVDFYNVPTTMLSQIDSSVGGKVAINFCGIKNIIGAFYQPKAVFIDGNVLSTLPQRQISNGLAEAVKMSLTSDAELFEYFEKGDITDTDTICEKSLRIKIDVVQKDEKESGLRRILNFGHTIGHGVESESFGKLYHGECVALGMIPMCSPGVRARLIPVLEKLHLPTTANCDIEKAAQALTHDKKCTAEGIAVVLVNTPGSFEITKMTADELKEKMSLISEEAQS